MMVVVDCLLWLWLWRFMDLGVECLVVECVDVVVGCFKVECEW